MKKIEEILVATGNKGKLAEISLLLNKIGIKALSTADFGLKEPEENGASFEENSIIKAKYYGKVTKLIALADDSGFCVEDLNGWPGIISARLVKNGNYSAAFDEIEKNLIAKGINPRTTRSKAYFICNLSIYNPLKKIVKSFEGRVDGVLNFPAIGNNGFGYDPIFIPEGQKITFAQMTTVQKDLISHRSKAFDGFLQWLKNGSW